MGDNYKILTAITRSELELRVEELWADGFRPVGAATFSRNEPSITTTGIWVQAVSKHEPEVQGASYLSSVTTETIQTTS